MPENTDGTKRLPLTVERLDRIYSLMKDVEETAREAESSSLSKESVLSSLFNKIEGKNTEHLCKSLPFIRGYIDYNAHILCTLCRLNEDITEDELDVIRASRFYDEYDEEEIGIVLDMPEDPEARYGAFEDFLDKWSLTDDNDIAGTLHVFAFFVCCDGLYEGNKERLIKQRVRHLTSDTSLLEKFESRIRNLCDCEQELETVKNSDLPYKKAVVEITRILHEASDEAYMLLEAVKDIQDAFYGPVPEKEPEPDYREILRKSTLQDLLSTALMVLCYAERSWKGSFYKNLYNSITDEDIKEAMQSGIDFHPVITEALQSGNFIGGIDNSDFDGEYSLYFTEEGMLMKYEEQDCFVQYFDMVKVHTSPKGLIIEADKTSLSQKPVTLYINHNDCVCLVLLRHIRELLLRLRRDRLRLDITGSDTEKIVELINTSVAKIAKTDSCSYYTSDMLNAHDEKLRNALNGYAVKVRRNEVVAFIDSSFGQKGKDGLVFTGEGIAFDYAFEKLFLYYREIEALIMQKNDLLILGHFNEVKNPDIRPSISNTYFHLDALADFICEVLLYDHSEKIRID